MVNGFVSDITAPGSGSIPELLGQHEWIGIIYVSTGLDWQLKLSLHNPDKLRILEEFTEFKIGLSHILQI